DGYVAAVIARRLLLLVTLVVFFVYDNQPQILDGRENAGPGRYDHGCLARATASPLLSALGVLKSRVQDGDLFAESMVELTGDGRRQRDLGYQQQRTAA